MGFDTISKFTCAICSRLGAFSFGNSMTQIICTQQLRKNGSRGVFLMPLDPFILAHTAAFVFKPNGDSRAFSSAVTTSGTTIR